MSSEDEIRELLRGFGLEPEEVGYNEALDLYGVYIAAEGTDERYLRDINALGSAGPVDVAVDAYQVRTVETRLQDTVIGEGRINVLDPMGYHLRLEIVSD